MKSTQRPDPARREAAITAAAREIAESEGWPAVTVRRLAGAIGYSQPVLYQHFPLGRPEIVAAVARQGFAELAGLLQVPAPAADSRATRAAVRETARAYLSFARSHPASYQAMFEMSSLNDFATDSTPVELRTAFAAVVALLGGGPDGDIRAELFWSLLHGLATLERDGRIPPAPREARIEAIAAMFG